MIVAISILSVLLGLFIFFTINLLKKNEKCEDIINSYREHLQITQQEIQIIDTKLNETDQKGTFRSDDEVGFFFNSIKGLRDRLLKFKIDL